ncbi:MAG: carboxypeptidase regulatory-like domain-containing protein [Gemmatimonadota bacterium]|nr:carboxypeptidase regulatory-like domain-containing protein [Gemmatimonadota bacterium]
MHDLRERSRTSRSCAPPPPSFALHRAALIVSLLLATLFATSDAAAWQVPQAQALPEATGCGGRASLAIAVTDESGLIAIPGATVVLRWTDAVRRPVREETAADGRLFLCVPRDASQATLWAEFGDASSEEATLALEAGAAHELELGLLFGESRTGRIIGHISDAQTDQPVVAAAVSVAGRAQEVQTNRRGRFIFSGLPIGEYELSVRHIGYAPLAHPVTVTLGHTTQVEVSLPPDPVELEPIVATATRPRRLEIKGFYERRYWGELLGGGEFFTAEDIERRNPSRITHMIADAPGVRLANCDVWGHGCKLYSTTHSRGFSDQGCKLNIYLDGILAIRGSKERWSLAAGGSFAQSQPRESINDLVLPTEIAGIEVYTGAASLPAEFGGPDSRCGAVMIWTK